MSGTVVITEWEGMEDEGFEWIMEPEDAVRAMEEAKLLGHGEGEGEGEGGGGGGGDRACKRIMIVGCGSSKLSKILYDRGHKRITNVDIDESIIADMRRRYENEAPEMSWVACDITRAKGSLAEDEIFDLVLDKGTLDALLCADGVTDGYMEILRLLAVDGVFLVISFRPAELISRFLRVAELPVEVQVKKLETRSLEREANMFVLRKMGKLPHVDLEGVREYQNEVIKRWYQEETPLLTKARVTMIREGFTNAGGGKLPLETCYEILFLPEERSSYGYNFEHFLEDLKDFRGDEVMERKLVANDGARSQWRRWTWGRDSTS